MTHEPVLSDRAGLVSCSGKRCYDFAGARKLAKRMRRNQDKHVEAYHCHHCRHWHIGAIGPKRAHRPPEPDDDQSQIRPGQ